MLIPPRRIVLSGGGIRALAHIGALEVLEAKGLLKSVREYVGVSAGAFLGFVLALGYTLQEMRTLCALFDFTMIQHLDPEAALNFLTTFGLDDGQNLVKLLGSLLRLKGYPLELTFAEWRTRQPHAVGFRCFAADLQTTSIREFSFETTPHVTLVDALRSTTSLPGYFTPVKDPETGHFLVDGGVLHNFPLSFLKEDEIEESLGISFSYEHIHVTEITDIPTFLQQIFACYYIPRTYRIHEEHRERCIIIPCGHIAPYEFASTKEERERIMNYGSIAAKEFCERTWIYLGERRKPIRRYSVG